MKKIAVITGGTGGVGKAVCQAFLAADYHVVTTYRKDEELRDLLESTMDHKDQLQALRIDVTDESSLDDLALRVKKDYGHVDSLVCLVGGFAPGTLGKDTVKTLNMLMTLNVTSFALTVEALLTLLTPGKKEQSRYGHIVAVSARPALVPTKGLGLYGASKAALANLVKTLSVELLERNITVNAIAPSTIDTLANRKSMPKADFKQWVKPEQIAETILYLCSDQANVTSGAILPVYGKA